MSAFDWSGAPAPWNLLGPQIAEAMREDCAPGEEVHRRRRAVFRPKGCSRKHKLCWVRDGRVAYQSDARNGAKPRTCKGCKRPILPAQ